MTPSLPNAPATRAHACEQASDRRAGFGAPRANAGFTLIELLVVITVILILAGLSLGGLGMALTTAKRAKTQALIGDVEGLIIKFYDMTGRYPVEDESHGPLEGNSKLVATLQNNVKSDLFGSEQLRGGLLFDAWGSPLRYQHFLYLPDSGPRAGKNPESYQLWSIGPDQTDQNGGGDDVTNWK